jgi:hypothetical protein
MCVRHTARQEDRVAGVDIDLGVATLDDVLALQDVEKLVLLGMDVQGRIGHRQDFFEDRESATSRIRRGLEDKLDLAEDDSFGEGFV